MKLGMQVGLGPGHIMLDGDPAPPPPNGQSPQIFGPYVLWPNGWIKMPLRMEVGRGPGDFVLDGNPAPLLKRGGAPQKISAHLSCGQTAGWIKMPLGMEVGRGPGDFVLDGDPAPLPQKRAHSPSIFGPCLLWPNGGMDRDATWYTGS